jgi:hypothetical protein
VTFRIYSPKTLEEVMTNIGHKELDDDVQITMTVELMADICTRIIRLEEEHNEKTE